MRTILLGLFFLGSFGITGQVTTLGQGEVNLVPDQVHFFIVVKGENDDASRALGQSDALANSIFEGFTNLGVPEENMQTMGLNVYPANEYRDGRIVRSYFVAEHRIKITVNDLSLIGQGFKIVNNLEGEHSISIQLDSTQRKAAEDQALANAISNARKKATIMAEAENLVVGEVLQMTNTVLAAPQGPYEEIRTSDMTSTAVMPGQITVFSSATVVYEIHSLPPGE